MPSEGPLVPLDWLKDDDIVILEYLVETSATTTPKLLAIDLDIGHSQIKKRLGILEEHNLVTGPDPDEIPEGLSGRGVYRITDLGRRIASGDITIGEMREMERKGKFDSGGE